MIKRDKKSREDTLPSAFLKEIKAKNGYIDTDKLKKIGEGGTHNVFEYQDMEEFVVKVRGGDFLPTDQASIAKDLNRKHDELKAYFGNNRVLDEKYFSNHFVCGDEVSGPYLFSIQARNYYLKNSTKIDFSCEYAEYDSEFTQKQDFYKEMNDGLLGNMDFSDEEPYLIFNNKLRKVFRLIERDGDFREILQELLLKFKKYFDKTGNFLDFVGEENIIFFKENDKWTYKVGSVLKNETMENVSESLKLLSQNPLGLNKKSDLKRNLLNGLNLVRMLNVLGLKSGLGKILDIQLNDKQQKNLSRVKF